MQVRNYKLEITSREVQETMELERMSEAEVGISVGNAD